MSPITRIICFSIVLVFDAYLPHRVARTASQGGRLATHVAAKTGSHLSEFVIFATNNDAISNLHG